MKHSTFVLIVFVLSLSVWAFNIKGQMDAKHDRQQAEEVIENANP